MHHYRLETEPLILIGNIGIGCNSRFKRAEIGYWLDKQYWNQGYMSEAVRRVMEKAGMQYEGTLRNYVQKDNQDKDMGICAILKENYEEESS